MTGLVRNYRGEAERSFINGEFFAGETSEMRLKRQAAPANR